MVAKLSPTVLSVSVRLRTRSTMLAKRGSFGKSGWPSTSAQSFFHSRSLWIEIRMSLPSFERNTP